MPKKYFLPIKTYSEKYAVDPTVILAICQVESRFREAAVSSVGAVGVMQILPATGEWIASALGRTEYSQADLLSADTNIEFGAFYLSYLYTRFNSDWCVYAAYNAGEGAVNEWLSRGIDESSIPYPETKEYVFRVKRAIVRYKMKKIMAFY